MKRTFLFGFFLLAYFFSGAQPGKKIFAAGRLYLCVEVLDDSTLHVQYTTGVPGGGPIPVTEMIANTSYKGTPRAVWKGNSLSTGSVFLQIDSSSLSLSIRDKAGGDPLTRIQPLFLHDSLAGIRGSATAFTAYYGLGEQFKENSSSIDYQGKIKVGDEYGNRMLGFNGGGGPNMQMPVLYAVERSSFRNYAVFVDDFLRQKFDCSHPDYWSDEINDTSTSFYIFSGSSIRSLHHAYVELTGHPLMLPKKMFGLWISEFGFDDWGEMEDKLRTLRLHKFPVDGTVYDVQWFGVDHYKVRNDTMPLFENVYMGRLAWDERHFPEPVRELDKLKQEGIGTMVIQEPFVAHHLPEFDEYENHHLLVKDSSDVSGYIFRQPMWFSGPTGGGMFDYTNPATGDYVFQHKLLPLIQMGLTGNWLDLGEPEHFQPWARYYRGTHRQVNNMYAFLWEKSIYEGYKKYGVRQRPFMLCRTGAPGMQRFGAIIWNGDPMLKAGNLIATAANLANLTLAGVFYYGTCAGGFYHRPDPLIDTGAFYTRWYAYSCLYDQPIWPHDFNPTNIPGNECAPDRIGDVASNLFATRQRYALLPYYYSLSRKAYKEGECVYAPLLYYYQEDSVVKDLGTQLMIGEYLMGTVPDTYNGMQRKVYLPKGVWYNWHDQTKTVSQGQYVTVPYFRNAIFTLPLFAREGAIIPLAVVDGETMNALGMRMDGSARPDLLLRIFPSAVATSFVCYDDDGQTVDYLRGDYAETVVTQRLEDGGVRVTIGGTTGPYRPVAASYGAVTGSYRPVTARNTIVEVVYGAPAHVVVLNGKGLRQFREVGDFEAAGEGFINLPDNRIRCKTGVKDITRPQVLLFKF